MPSNIEMLFALVSSEQAGILHSVIRERMRQDGKWGQQNHHPGNWDGILGEEFGEVQKAVNESDWDNYRTELIETAAVALAMVESLDRNGPPAKTFHQAGEQQLRKLIAEWRKKAAEPISMLPEAEQDGAIERSHVYQTCALELEALLKGGE